METSRMEMFRKLLERDPENPMVLYSLGSELFKEQKYSEAREYLSRAVRNKPDYSVAHRTLGRPLWGGPGRRIHENHRPLGESTGFEELGDTRWTAGAHLRGWPGPA